MALWELASSFSGHPTNKWIYYYLDVALGFHLVYKVKSAAGLNNDTSHPPPLPIHPLTQTERTNFQIYEVHIIQLN